MPKEELIPLSQVGLQKGLAANCLERAARETNSLVTTLRSAVGKTREKFTSSATPLIAHIKAAKKRAFIVYLVTD